MSGTTLTEQSFLGGTNFENGRQRNHWIACYTMLLLWMVMLLLLYLVDGQRRRPASSMTASRPVEGRPVTEVTTIDVYDKPNTWSDKFRRSVRSARLSFILLLSATVITALGYGPTGGTTALIWISFAIGAVWVIAELFLNSHWLRLVFSILLFPLIVIIWGLAFRSRID